MAKQTLTISAVLSFFAAKMASQPECNDHRAHYYLPNMLWLSQQKSLATALDNADPETLRGAAWRMFPAECDTVNKAIMKTAEEWLETKREIAARKALEAAHKELDAAEAAAEKRRDAARTDGIRSMLKSMTRW